MNSPCLDCENRRVGCHSECEDYKVFAAENEARNAEAYKQRKAEGEFNDYQRAGKYRTAKERKFKK